MFNFKTIVIPVLFSVFVVSGCTNGSKGMEDPQARLSAYISKTFQVRSVGDKETLQSYLTGEAKQRLIAWDQEQFLSAFLDSKRKFEKLAYKEVTPINDSEVAITYELTFLDRSKKDKETVVTNKKMAYLVRENGQWFIRDVKNIKLLVEYKNEMSLP